MKIQMEHTVNQKELFFYFLLLTFFFILFEVSFFIQCNKAYLADFAYAANQLRMPTSALPHVVFYFLAQIFLHFIFCCLIFYVALGAINFLYLSHRQAFYFSLFCWFLGMGMILVANQYFFPNSKFAELIAILLPSKIISKIVLIIFGSLSVLIVFISMIAWLKKFMFYFLLFFGLMGPAFLLTAIHHIKTQDSVMPDYPNIILVGLDSLRPDFLGFFGRDIQTPFLDSMLNQSVVFDEAVTPLARTFPSLSSVLTGQYPKENKLRTNLAPQKQVDLSHTLPAILKQYGYETIFATDETRFSNIDRHFGFDRIISPPIGINDFLIGTFNDFPLSNLLVNTSLGRWLFPYSYANRPVYFTYNPDSFLKLMAPILKTPRSKPLMLTVHFCLTHYPYLWADSNGSVSIVSRYQNSVMRLDQQVKDFFSLLKENHILDRAILVLFSDHGEALELPFDRITTEALFVSSSKKKTIPHFYPPSLDDEAINQSAGHGTDVLGLPQYHTLLAFKLFGMDEFKQKQAPGVYSLLDIKPTILDLIHIQDNQTSMGRSLKNVLIGEKEVLTPRHIFIESDFSPESIRTIYPETRKILLEGIALFEIDPKTTRLTIKNDMNKMILASKQYADIYDEWMLALYPGQNRMMVPILINLRTGRWTNDLNSSFAKQSPARAMMTALKKRLN